MKDQDTLAAKQKVAAMSFGEKLKYYLGYYKIHIIVVLALAVGLALFIFSYVTAPDTVLYLGVMDGELEKSQELMDDYCETLQGTPKATIEINLELSTSPTTDGLTLYSEIQLRLAGKNLDIVFTTAEGVPYLAKSGVLMAPDLWMTDVMKEEWGDRVTEFEALYEGTGMNSTDTFSMQPMAVDLSGTVFAKKYGLGDKNCYMVVPSNTERLEAIQAFLDYVYKLESKE